jgi:hypothetical protein
VDIFGGTSLAWASMGLEAHRLDAKGSHAKSLTPSFGGLEDTLEGISYPSHAKRFAWRDHNVTIEELTSLLGLGFGGDEVATC